MENGQKNPKRLEYLAKVQSMIVECYSRPEILQYATDHEWQVGKRTMDTYIKTATNTMKEEFLKMMGDETKLKAEQIQKLDLLYKRAVQIQDNELARKCATDKAELLFGKKFNFSNISAFEREMKLKEKENKESQTETTIIFGDSFEKD